MGQLIDRGDGLLVIRYRDARGHRVDLQTAFRVGAAEDVARAREQLADLKRTARSKRASARRLARRLTVRVFAQRWIERRRARGVRCVDQDASRLRRHVLPVIGDRRLTAVKPDDLRDLILDLRDDGVLAPRSVRRVWRVVATMFRDAVLEGVIKAKDSPAIIERGDLPKDIDADPLWRAGAIYSATEVATILTAPQIDLGRRVIWGLMFLAGLRPGEAFGARWDCIVPAEGLDKLIVARSYVSRFGIDGRTKTGGTRHVPIHAYLGKMLELWRHIFEDRWRRKPCCDGPARDGTPRADLIVPRDAKHGCKAWTTDAFIAPRHSDLWQLGLRIRRAHDARRTFVTQARRRSERDHVRRLTHPRHREEFDQYEEALWAESVAVILKMEIPLPDEVVI
jgi:integrase